MNGGVHHHIFAPALGPGAAGAAVAAVVGAAGGAGAAEFDFADFVPSGAWSARRFCGRGQSGSRTKRGEAREREAKLEFLKK